MSPPLTLATANTDVYMGVDTGVGNNDYVVSEYSPTNLNLKGDFDEVDGGANSDDNFLVVMNCSRVKWRRWKIYCTIM
jgi:hypothetical protein